MNFAQGHRFDLNHLERSESGAWPNYAKGVAWAIEQAAQARLASGFDLAIAGDVPLGAGLSSSASLQVDTGFHGNSLSVAEPRPPVQLNRRSPTRD